MLSSLLLSGLDGSVCHTLGSSQNTKRQGYLSTEHKTLNTRQDGEVWRATMPTAGLPDVHTEACPGHQSARPGQATLSRTGSLGCIWRVWSSECAPGARDPSEEPGIIPGLTPNLHLAGSLPLPRPVLGAGPPGKPRSRAQHLPADRPRTGERPSQEFEGSQAVLWGGQACGSLSTALSCP